MKKNHQCNLVDLNEKFRDILSPLERRQIKKELKDCPVCQEHLAFLCLVHTSSPLQGNLQEMPRFQQGCPADTDLLTYAQRAFNKDLAAKIKSHLDQCENCILKMEQFQEDQMIFQLYEESFPETQEAIVAPAYVPQTAAVARPAMAGTKASDPRAFLSGLLNTIQKALWGDYGMPTYYKSLGEYAVIMILILVAACGVILLFDHSVKQQYARITWSAGMDSSDFDKP